MFLIVKSEVQKCLPTVMVLPQIDGGSIIRDVLTKSVTQKVTSVTEAAFLSSSFVTLSLEKRGRQGRGEMTGLQILPWLRGT